MKKNILKYLMLIITFVGLSSVSTYYVLDNVTHIYADETTTANGTDGTATWTLKDGTLSFTSGTLSKDDTQSIISQYNNSITKIDTSSADKVTLPSDSSGLFANSKATSMDLSKLDTSNVTDMSSLFSSNSNVISLDLSSFDTSNVTNMGNMFSGDGALTKIDLTSFNTSKVKYMDSMFTQDFLLSSLDLSNFNTSNVINMSDMFNNDFAITSLDLSKWNTSNVTNMGHMFYHTLGLTKLDLSNFDTKKVQYMDSMFKNDLALTEINIANFDTSSVQNNADMFANDSNLKTLTFGNKFKNISSSINLLSASWIKKDDDTHTGYTTDTLITHLANDDSSGGTYTKVLAAGVDGTAPYVIDLNNNLNFYAGKLDNSTTRSILKQNSISKIDTSNAGGKVVLPDDSSGLFEDSTASTIDFTNIDTSNVTDMSSMFSDDYSITSLDLSNFNTSNVTDMNSMLFDLSAVHYINLGNFNTTKATDNQLYMLSDESSLSQLQLGNKTKLSQNTGLSTSHKWAKVGSGKFFDTDSDLLTSTMNDTDIAGFYHTPVAPYIAGGGTIATMTVTSGDDLSNVQSSFTHPFDLVLNDFSSLSVVANLSNLQYNGTDIDKQIVVNNLINSSPSSLSTGKQGTVFSYSAFPTNGTSESLNYTPDFNLNQLKYAYKGTYTFKVNLSLNFKQ